MVGAARALDSTARLMSVLFPETNRKSIGVADSDIRLPPIKYLLAANPQAAWSIHSALARVRWAAATGNPQAHALQQAAVHR